MVAVDARSSARRISAGCDPCQRSASGGIRVHSPAEEVGLMGQRLATRVQNALDRVPATSMVELLRAIGQMADGSPSRPTSATASPKRSSSFRVRSRCGTTSSGTRTTSRRPSSSARSGFPTCTSRCPRCARSFASRPIEEEWLRECWTPAHREDEPDVRAARRRRGLRVGDVEGLHQVHGAEPERDRRPAHRVHLPSPSSASSSSPPCSEQDPSIRLPAPRRHARVAAPGSARAPRGASAGPNGQIVFVDPKLAARGPRRARRGGALVHGDSTGCPCSTPIPASCVRSGDEVFYGDCARGRRHTAMRACSTCWRTPTREWTSRRCAPSSARTASSRRSARSSTRRALRAVHRSGAGRAAVHRRGAPGDAAARAVDAAPLRRRFTTLPDGERIELPEWARRERDSLVLKPNRSYGGEGVIVGHAADAERRGSPRSSARSATPSRWVVLQQAAPIPVKSLPRVRRRRSGGRRAVLRRDGVRAEPVRRGADGTRVAAAGGERRAARGDVRGDGECSGAPRRSQIGIIPNA